MAKSMRSDRLGVLNLREGGGGGGGGGWGGVLQTSITCFLETSQIVVMFRWPANLQGCTGGRWHKDLVTMLICAIPPQLQLQFGAPQG